MTQEHLSIARDPEPAPVLFKQLLVENLLEFADGLGHRRLADGEHLRRASHGILADHFNEGAQMAEADTTVDHLITHNLKVIYIADSFILQNQSRAPI